MAKKLTSITLFICLILLNSQARVGFYQKYNASKISTVVIDAGHGGHDSGCIGHSVAKEKDVALKISLQLGKYIEDNIEDVKVIYTRKTDVFIQLHERAAIANRNNSDLFISIHCNASSNKAAYGTETYIMGLHRTEANLSVAKRENAVIELEDDFEMHYDGFDPNSPEAHIIMSLNQNAYIEQSSNIADKIQTQFKQRVNRVDRGVKQAGFLVLYKTTMPSILVETGFLTNKEEERFLNSTKGQDYIASAIYRAFKDYKNDVEGHAVKAETAKNTPVSQEELLEENIPVVVTEDIPAVVIHDFDPNKSTAEDVIFKIQLIVSRREINIPIYKPGDDISLEYVKEDLKRYLVGSYGLIEEAESMKELYRQKGFSDAFIVAYKKGERVDLITVVGGSN